MPRPSTERYRQPSTTSRICSTPSPVRFRNDSDFTPSGRYRWDAERYRTKLSRIARTIDDAGFDIVALAEVESERAVRDLTATLADDYNFIHRTTSDRRGIDIALLYKGDKFFPSEVSQIPSGTSREFLFVRGDLIGHETGLLVCHLPSKFNDKSYRTGAAVRLAAVADSLLCKAGCERLLIMGDFNGELHEPAFRKAFRPRAERSIRRREVPPTRSMNVPAADRLYCWKANGCCTTTSSYRNPLRGTKDCISRRPGYS